MWCPLLLEVQLLEMVLEELLHKIVSRVQNLVSIDLIVDLDEARDWYPVYLLLVVVGLVPVFFQVKDHTYVLQTLMDGLIALIDVVVTVLKAKPGSH